MGELYDMDECGFPMLHRGVRTTCGKPTSFFYHNPPLDLVVCRCDEHMNLLYSERIDGVGNACPDRKPSSYSSTDSDRLPSTPQPAHAYR